MVTLATTGWNFWAMSQNLKCLYRVLSSHPYIHYLRQKHTSGITGVLVQFITQSCLTLCDPMDCSMPGFPVHHQPSWSNSCPSSQWCHPIISSSVVPFSSCPQSLPALGPFPVSQFFISSDQSIGVWASASVLLMYIQEVSHGSKIYHFNDVFWLDEDHPYYCPSPLWMGFPHGASGKESACQCKRHKRSLGWEDPLEEIMATHSSILAWEIPWTEETGGLQSMGSKKSQTQLSD